MPNIDKVLADLAAKLGTSVEYLWPILVRQVLVDWWANLTVGVALMLVGYFLLRYGLRCYRRLVEAEEKAKHMACPNCYYKNLPDFDDLRTHELAAAVVGGILLAASFLGTLFICVSQFSWLLCPEAVALQRLLSR